MSDDRTMTLTRHFRASPAQVYAAWTDPEALPRWFGPSGYSCHTHAIDIRVGGEWRFDMTGEGMVWPNRHRWTELSPHSRIAFIMDGMEGDTDAKQVVVTLEPEGEGTRLTQVMTFATPESLKVAESYGAPAKGQETLGKLAAYLDRQGAAAPA
jgi:uncharacterized protein YndB with AHSA1/START domain